VNNFTEARIGPKNLVWSTHANCTTKQASTRTRHGIVNGTSGPVPSIFDRHRVADVPIGGDPVRSPVGLVRREKSRPLEYPAPTARAGPRSPRRRRHESTAQFGQNLIALVLDADAAGTSLARETARQEANNNHSMSAVAVGGHRIAARRANTSIAE
jgi:hypothetical protein